MWKNYYKPFHFFFTTGQEKQGQVKRYIRMDTQVSIKDNFKITLEQSFYFKLSVQTRYRAKIHISDSYI